MPHPWECSRPDWMGLWTAWFNGRYSCPQQGVGTRYLLSPSQPRAFYDSMVPWFHAFDITMNLLPVVRRDLCRKDYFYFKIHSSRFWLLLPLSSVTAWFHLGTSIILNNTGQPQLCSCETVEWPTLRSQGAASALSKRNPAVLWEWGLSGIIHWALLGRVLILTKQTGV